ncbi:hypothetical protein F4778DRAFT_654113 [Xylariomycetidae sp. FL2044]|nr:hypothetical protein F4778DRAFT_654113 [Xylariomycetidae sp. FL2044]
MRLDAEGETTTANRQNSNASSPECPDSRSTSRSKANVRASLACVQCRSKHVKCDATLPACRRCQLEDKPCFYAKSRRGIRDPRKRSLIPDKPPVAPSSTPSFPPLKLSTPVRPAHNVGDLPGGWSAKSLPSSPPMNEDEVLLSEYYTYFHPNLPCLPPKKFFLLHMNSDPNPYQFLLSVIRFCGSLFADRIPSEDLREVAFSAACGQLPFTVQSVQGLVLLSVAAIGEHRSEFAVGWTNRAATMAMEIDLHRKSFADSAPDPVLAESYRRTWWIVSNLSAVQPVQTGGQISTPVFENVDVDLPCEEWEYDSGAIPKPISMSEYEEQTNAGRSDFSSMAYLIEMCNIQRRFVTPHREAPEGQKQDLFGRADARICDWIRRVPRWKMDLVDPNGRVDVVLFHAVGLAHISRLVLRDSAARSGVNLRQYFPLGPARGPDRKGQFVKNFGWSPYSIDVQAANSFCDLFQYSFPSKTLSPVMASMILRAALTYMDACVFLGLDSPVFREKINMLIRILMVNGETWLWSRKVADEIRAVAKEYLAEGVGQSPQANVTQPETWAAVPSSLLPEASTLNTDFNSDTAYQIMDEIEYWTTGDSWPAALSVYPV